MQKTFYTSNQTLNSLGILQIDMSEMCLLSNISHDNLLQSFDSDLNQNLQQPLRFQFSLPHCQTHNKQIILICVQSNCNYNILLCCQCINGSLQHLKNHYPLLTVDEFFQWINTVNYGQHKFLQEDFIQTKKNEMNENNLIESISRLIENQVRKKFDEIYYNMEGKMIKIQKCSERIKQLNNELSIFEQTDQQILENLKQKKSKQLEEYILDLLTSNKSNQNPDLKINYYTKCIQNLKQQIYKLISQIKTINLQNINNLLIQYTDHLIQSFFKSSYDKISVLLRHKYIDLHISTQEEFHLLTQTIIQPETKLILHLSGINKGQVKKLFQKLHNFTIKSLQLDWKYTKVTEFEYFFSVYCLQYTLDLYGVMITNQSLQSLVKVFEMRRKLSQRYYIKQLNLILGNNNLNCKQLKLLIPIFKQIQLIILHLDLQLNSLQKESIYQLSKVISKLINLKYLEINLNGFSLSKNIVEDSGCIYLIEAIAKIEFLKQLKLGLGFTEITGKSLQKIIEYLSNQKQLITFQLEIFKNYINSQSICELCKAISLKTKISRFILNINNISMSVESIKFAYRILKQSPNLQFIQILANKCGVPQEIRDIIKKETSQMKNIIMKLHF